MYPAIICCPGCDVIKFEINPINGAHSVIVFRLHSADSSSVAILYGSEFQATYLVSWWDTRNTNRSISRIPNFKHRFSFIIFPGLLICLGHWGDTWLESWSHVIFWFFLPPHPPFTAGKPELPCLPSEYEQKSFFGTWERFEMLALVRVTLVRLYAFFYLGMSESHQCLFFVTLPPNLSLRVLKEG